MGCSSSAVRAVGADARGCQPEDSLRGGRSEGSPVTKGGAAPEWTMQLVKRQGEILGAGLGNTGRGAVIFNIQENGLLDAWNKRQQPFSRLRPGITITEVNGVVGYWNILEELGKPGVLDIRVSAEPPPRRGRSFFHEIAEMGRSLEERWSLEDQGCRSAMLRLQPGGQFSSLPTVSAADCGVDRCAICIDDVGPDEPLVQLPCRHAFHAPCVARWLTEAGAHSQGKRQCCPLCCQKVVCSPSGGIAAGRPED